MGKEQKDKIMFSTNERAAKDNFEASIGSSAKDGYENLNIPSLANQFEHSNKGKLAQDHMTGVWFFKSAGLQLEVYVKQHNKVQIWFAELFEVAQDEKCACKFGLPKVAFRLSAYHDEQLAALAAKATFDAEQAAKKAQARLEEAAKVQEQEAKVAALKKAHAIQEGHTRLGYFWAASGQDLKLLIAYAAELPLILGDSEIEDYIDIIAGIAAVSPADVTDLI